MTYHERSSFYGESADAEGRFRLKGYEGQTFVVEAVSEPPGGGPSGRSAPLAVTLSEQHGPLKLVVKKNR